MANVITMPQRGNSHGRVFEPIPLGGVIRLMLGVVGRAEMEVTWFEVASSGPGVVSIAVVAGAPSKDVRLSWHSTNEFDAALRGSLDGQIGELAPSVTVGLARDCTFAMLPLALDELQVPADFLKR